MNRKVLEWFQLRVTILRKVKRRRDELIVLSGTANPDLSKAVAFLLNLSLGACTIERFPHREIHIVVEEDAQGKDVFLSPPTDPPVADHLLELMLLADACRSGLAVVPFNRNDQLLPGILNLDEYPAHALLLVQFAAYVQVNALSLQRGFDFLRHDFKRDVK